LAYSTALAVLSKASVNLGLGVINDAYGSSDARIVRMRSLLEDLGRELWLSHDWSQLRKEHTFVTSEGVYQYPLPADFGRMVDDSTWNRTSAIHAKPLTPQGWQYLKGITSGTIWHALFKVEGGEIRLWPDSGTPAGHTFAFPYVSSYWVQPNGESAPTLDAPSANTDTLWFEPLLLSRGLERDFLAATGFDTTAAERKFLTAWNQAIEADTPAAALRLDREPSGVPTFTVPDTGYGS
jgi:hypothetical protein